MARCWHSLIVVHCESVISVGSVAGCKQIYTEETYDALLVQRRTEKDFCKNIKTPCISVYSLSISV